MKTISEKLKTLKIIPVVVLVSFDDIVGIDTHKILFRGE